MNQSNTLLFDATRDVTEKDMVMRKYHRLMDEQAWHDVHRRIQRNKKEQERIAKLYAAVVLASLALLSCAIIGAVKLIK